MDKLKIISNPQDTLNTTSNESLLFVVNCAIKLAAMMENTMEPNTFIILGMAN